MATASPLAYFILWAVVSVYAYALSLATGWGSGIAHRTAGQYFAGIDGLRGILAMNIFFHHSLVNYYYLQTGAWLLPPSNFYAQLGPMSVTMFFFVTGFLF